MIMLDRLALHAELSPFGVEPRANLHLELAGLRGPELAALAPELTGVVDASGLADGRLALDVGGTWMGRRRGPLHFDTTGGVPLELSLKELAFRDGEDGEVLLTGLLARISLELIGGRQFQSRNAGIFQTSGIGKIIGAGFRYFLAAAADIRGHVPDARFLVASFNDAQAEMALQQIAGCDVPVEIHVGKTEEIIHLAECCVSVSGSVSLQLLHYLTCELGRNIFLL